MAAANHEWCHCGTPHHCGQYNAHRECMGPVIGNGLQRRLLCDWGVWARLHRAPPLSPRPATPVSKANCHTTGIKEATSHLRGGKGHSISDVMWEALTVLKQDTHRQQKIHLHCYTGDLASYNNWIGMFPNTVFGFTVKTTQMPEYVQLARQMDLGRLVLETDSPMLSRPSGHPYDVIGHATNVAKYRNLPAWVVPCESVLCSIDQIKGAAPHHTALATELTHDCSSPARRDTTTAIAASRTTTCSVITTCIWCTATITKWLK